MKVSLVLAISFCLFIALSTLAANAQLDVYISINYTVPKSFESVDRGPNDYLAGSPLSLTCEVQKSGADLEPDSYFYEWTNTCPDVSFTSGRFMATVDAPYLRSSDDGTHTCTVYGANGEIESDNVTINVVGVAIYVSNNGHGKLLSNNDMIIASPSTDKISEFRCISGSNQSHVGRLISVNGRGITHSRLDPFFIYRGDAGVVRVRSAYALRSSEQGIYTCRIPDENGVSVDFNVGLYLSGSTVPISFTKTDYKSNGDYYLITFTTTGSPPTTVVWTRNKIQIEEGDDKYVVSQELTDRITSTYNNQLKIYGGYEDAIGSYTCTATNTISRVTANKIVNEIDISGHENVVIVGLSTVLHCSTTLDTIKLEWYRYKNDVVLNSSLTSSVEYILQPESTDLNGARYTCLAHTVSGKNYSKTITVSVEELTNVVTIDGPSNPLLAGNSYTITCSAIVDVTPTLKWTDASGNTIEEGNGISLSGPTVSGDMTTLNLTFANLLTSQGGIYTCVSIVDVPTSIQVAVTEVEVQIPLSQVKVTPYPNTITLSTTQSFQITCHTYLQSSVDTSVKVAHTWSGPSGVLSSNGHISITAVVGSDREFNSTLSISSLRSSDSGTYTCFSSASSSSSYIVSSPRASASLSITAYLKTTIQIDYTPPDQYPDYAPPYYRAASSATLRCVVEGATGYVSYRWSSTCRSCTASGYTSSSFTESMLTSRHAGVHTCTVTDSMGNTGSNSTRMDIYGAGIYVSYSYGYGGRQAAQPNNSFVNLHSISGYYSSGQVVVLYCCSNSSSSYIGSFTEPYGSTYSSSFNHINVERYSSSSTYSGCIRFQGYKHYRSYSVSYNQGVYMCNIPDSTGTTVRVNFALYAYSVRNVPTISRYDYSVSSNVPLTLTCDTRTSPPTEIAWQRNGVNLTLNDSTTEMIQTVTDRYSYYSYSNVLNIYDDPGSLVGNYTCTVGNSVGNRTSTVISIAGISLIAMANVAVVGRSISFNCSSDLDPISVQWYINESLVSETPGDFGTITYDIISTDEQGTVVTCSIFNSYGSQKKSVILEVVVPDDWASIEITNPGGDALQNNTHTLTCSVYAIEGMNIIPSISWYHPNGTVVVTGGRLTVGQIQTEETLTSLSLTFSPVFNDDGGLYSCIADITVPWMSTQPPAVTGTVNMIVTTQSMFQLKMGPLSHCSTWELSKALDLENSIKREIQKAVQSRCNCDLLSNSIYSGEFSCQTTTTEVIYRALIKGSNDNTATQLIEYIEDWLTDGGTLLYNVFRLRLSQTCPLRIESFDEPECGDEEQEMKQKIDKMSGSTLLAQDGCFKLQACDGNSKYDSASGIGFLSDPSDVDE